MKHPKEVLTSNSKKTTILPVCDHYAGSQKLMEKSMALQQQYQGRFDITFDCEDGASVSNPEKHIKMCSELLADSPMHGRIGVRVHDIHSRHFAHDLETLLKIAGDKVAYITIPKITSSNDAGIACDAVTHFALQFGKPIPPVHVLIETHGALREVFRIAAHPSIQCLSFGLMDFISDHHGAIPSSAMQAEQQFIHPLVVRAKLEISAACHAYGKTPSHNVITELLQPDITQSAAEKARSAFGYLRMWSIHPSQIPVILTAMLPTAEEIEEAESIILAAAKADWAPISHLNQDNVPQLHDRASYRYYWDVLEKAHASHLPFRHAEIQSFFTSV